MIVVICKSIVRPARPRRLSPHPVTARIVPLFPALCLLVLLSACTSTDTSDLQNFIEEVRASQKGRIDPIPSFTEPQPVDYTVAHLRDPFIKWSDPEQPSGGCRDKEDCVQPIENRRKEVLEQFPLDTLRMVGTLNNEEGHWAVVQSPDGMVHKVQVGNYMGQNHGRITEIGENGIKLVELVPDGLGGWLQRDAALALTEE